MLQTYSQAPLKYILTLWLTFKKNAYLASLLSQASLEIKRIWPGLWFCKLFFWESVSTSCKTFEVNRNAKLAKIFVRFIDVVIQLLSFASALSRNLTRAILFFVHNWESFIKSFSLVFTGKLFWTLFNKKYIINQGKQ